MKKSKVVILCAFLIAICGAFTTRWHEKKMPAGWIHQPGLCATYTLPNYCNGGDRSLYSNFAIWWWDAYGV